MGLERMWNNEWISDTEFDLKNLQDGISNAEFLQEWLNDDEIIKELEKNTKIDWNVKLPQVIPNDIIGVKPPSLQWSSKIATFELTGLTKHIWEIFAHVSIVSMQQADGSVRTSRRISFSEWINTKPIEFATDSTKRIELLSILEKHALEFLPKKQEEINELIWRSLWVIHYLPNSK